MATKRPGPRAMAAVDVHVGQRIRERRILLGWTQAQVAEMLGVTYQQAHKYETGVNRVSAGRLYEMARGLHVPVGYFYEGLGEEHPVTMHLKRRVAISRAILNITSEKKLDLIERLAQALA